MIRAFPLVLALASAPADDTSLRATVEVDASALGEAGDALSERLRSHGMTVLRDADVEEGDGEDDPVVSVVVEPLPQQAGYRCTYELRDGGEPVDGTQAATECRLCTDAELEEQVNAAIGRLIARMRTDGAHVTEPEPREPEPAPPQPVDTAPGPWRIGKMGQAGIGVSVVGGFTLGLGLGLAIAEPILLSKGTTRTGALQVPGITTAAIGGALLITGVVLLAVDQARSRRLAANPGGLTLRF